MIILNLLPPQVKLDRKTRELFVVFKNLIIVMLLITTVAAIILLVARGLLQNHFNRVVAESTLTTRQSNIFSTQLKTFKQRLQAVTDIQEKYIRWSHFIVSFAELIPTDVGITTLRIGEGQPAPVTITGVAKTRDQLLELQQRLQQSPIFPSSVVIPLENLLTRENVPFILTTTIDLSPFQ